MITVKKYIIITLDDSAEGRVLAYYEDDDVIVRVLSDVKETDRS